MYETSKYKHIKQNYTKNVSKKVNCTMYEKFTFRRKFTISFKIVLA